MVVSFSSFLLCLSLVVFFVVAQLRFHLVLLSLVSPDRFLSHAVGSLLSIWGVLHCVGNPASGLYLQVWSPMRIALQFRVLLNSEGEGGRGGGGGVASSVLHSGVYTLSGVVFRGVCIDYFAFWFPSCVSSGFL